MSASLVTHEGNLVVIGFGSVGQGLLPLLLRHVAMPRDRIHLVAADPQGAAIATAAGVALTVHRLTPHDLAPTLDPLVHRGTIVLNLAVDVSTVALIAYCRARCALYLDTCVEPWPGVYDDPARSIMQRSNHALREAALALARPGARDPTAVIAHGANPGLVSHFVKQALLDLAGDAPTPATRAEWAALAARLGVKVIHVAERDTQAATRPKAHGEFVNTWSIPGFLSEANQPAELGWGTHERTFPPDGKLHLNGSGAAICLTRRGAATRIRSWTPREGPFHGFLITHNEAISIADQLTQGDAEYRPTVAYVYHPCNDAVLSLHELAGRDWHQQPRQRLLMDEITTGHDELGVLLMGQPGGAYWFGSCLTIEAARQLAPHNNATSLQVAAGILGALVWAIENPQAGVVEAEDLDHHRILTIARPYLGDLTGTHSDWTPLSPDPLFPRPTDSTHPWQFANFRVD